METGLAPTETTVAGRGTVRPEIKVGLKGEFTN